MDVVGGEKRIELTAEVRLPCSSSCMQALATPDTPNCAGMGPRIRHEKARFAWDEELGPRSFKKDEAGEYSVCGV